MKRVVIHLIVISFIILGCGGGSGAIKSEISQPLVATNSNGDIIL